MAGSVVKTSVRIAGGVTRHRLTWVCDASGVVSANSVTLPSGTIVQVGFIPDSGGTQPTDLYDVVLNSDVYSTNVIDNGAGTSIGANLSNAAGKLDQPLTASDRPMWIPAGGYTLGVTNAGNAKGGIVDVYMVSGVQ